MTGGPVAATAAARRTHLRLLARRIRRRHLHVRVGPVLRVDRQHHIAAPGRRDQPDREQGRVLAGGVRRRDLRLRQCRLLRLHPRRRAVRRRGRACPHSLNAPIVGMVPSSDGGGYFMVASDGGVFAFGDARFEGSCPGMGGCSGAAVAVVPDASGNGYWLVTQTGHVYAFGDAAFYGAPGNQGSPVTSAVRTADGGGYWVLLANGTVDAYGDAVPHGGPVGSVGGFNPASAIFSDADGGGLLGRLGATVPSSPTATPRMTAPWPGTTSTAPSSLPRVSEPLLRPHTFRTESWCRRPAADASTRNARLRYLRILSGAGGRSEGGDATLQRRDAGGLRGRGGHRGRQGRRREVVVVVVGGTVVVVVVDGTVVVVVVDGVGRPAGCLVGRSWWSPAPWSWWSAGWSWSSSVDRGRRGASSWWSRPLRPYRRRRRDGDGGTRSGVFQRRHVPDQLRQVPVLGCLVRRQRHCGLAQGLGGVAAMLLGALESSRRRRCSS